MPNFTINVSCGGLQLFRTEEADNGIDNINRDKVVQVFTEKFPKSEGFEVMVVDWPTRTGSITYIE